MGRDARVLATQGQEQFVSPNVYAYGPVRGGKVLLAAPEPCVGWSACRGMVRAKRLRGAVIRGGDAVSNARADTERDFRRAPKDDVEAIRAFRAAGGSPEADGGPHV